MTDQTTDGPEVIDPSLAEAENTDPVEQGKEEPTPVSDDNAAPGATEDIPETRRDKRIQQLTERNSTLTGDRDHAMEWGKLQQARAERAEQLTTPTIPAEAPAPKMPTLENFDYDESRYNVAKQNWDDARIDLKVNERVGQLFQQQSQEATATQAAASWDATLRAFKADHADFDEVAFANQTTLDAIKDMPDGPALAYHLGQNPADAARISVLTGRPLDRELGKLSASMNGASPSSPKAVAQKQATTAPDPMSPVGGGQPTLSTEDETMDDFMARRNKEDAAARAGRGMGRV